MQHRIVIYNMQNKQVFAQKNLLMINQKNTLCRKNAISSSADPRTPRLLTSNIIQLICMYMYTYYVIFTAHIYMCVYNAVFGGYHPVHFRMVENTVGKSPTGILTLFI